MVYLARMKAWIWSGEELGASWDVVDIPDDMVELAEEYREQLMDVLGEKFRRLKVIFGDSAYGRSGLPDWVQETFGWILQTVLRPVGVQGFVVLPKRWIVERTFAWLARYRRHSKDYEKTVASSEAVTYIAMISLMSKRLANAQN